MYITVHQPECAICGKYADSLLFCETKRGRIEGGVYCTRHIELGKEELAKVVARHMTIAAIEQALQERRLTVRYG